jgi:hypothetical protein
MSTGNPKKRLFLFLSIAIPLIVLLIGGIFGLVLYQNTVNQTNAHNAYLSSLSGNGTLVFSDPLSSASGSQWSFSAGNDGSCQFAEGAYHIKQQSSSFLGCKAPRGTYSNFAFEVQLTIIQGGCGGVYFRDKGDGFFYYFHICQNGSYDITGYANYGGLLHMPYGKSSAIHAGLGKPNTIAIKAIGSAMTFYVNEQPITQAQDDSYAEGSIGLGAYPPGLDTTTEVAYTNAQLWTR